VAQICNHCEDFKNPVTSENGIAIGYLVDKATGLEIDLYLHHDCAEPWSQDFGIPVSSHAKAIGQ
jgi:hypothetical protein